MTVVAVPPDLDAVWRSRVAGAQPSLQLVPYEEASAPEVVLLGLGYGRRLVSLLAAWPTVRWVHTLSTGVDGLVGPFLAGRDVVLTNSAGAIAGPMAEFALACILASAKALPTLWQQQRSATWGREHLGIRQVAGRTAVVVGLGAVGRRLLGLCGAVGLRVLGVTARPERARALGLRAWGMDRLGEALSEADFVVLCAALTERSRGMLGAEQFEALRPGAVLVNVARSGLVDTRAMVDSLRSGRLAAAWVDVFEREPLPADDPLWSLAGVHVSPHVSSFAQENAERLLELFVENCRRYLAGEPLAHVVDVARGY